jgi:heterodisulfide reductase subunit C
MSTIERGGYFPRDNELEKCVAEFNEEYPNAYKTKSLILRAISNIKDFNLENDSMWFRKSCFFTMIVELCWAERLPEDIIKRLNDFDDHVLRSKQDKNNDYGMFYHAMYSGTNDRKARVIRSEMFRKYIIN